MAIITISRGTFGSAKQIAKSLCDSLGFQYISREPIIREAAASYDVSESALRDAILEVPGPLGFKAGQSMNYIKYIRAALLEKAINTPIVYHGYGSHLILSGVPNLLRIRIVAGMDYRIERILEKKQIPHQHAAYLVNEVDKKRAAWARTLWGADANDPDLFDITLNLDHLSVESTVSIIEKACRENNLMEDRNNTSDFEDELIKARILAALAREYPAKTTRIELKCRKGYVTLYGTLGSVKLVDAVLGITAGVNGVKMVANQLSIGADWFW